MKDRQKVKWIDVWGNEHKGTLIQFIDSQSEGVCAIVEEEGSLRSVQIHRVNLLEDAE